MKTFIVTYEVNKNSYDTEIMALDAWEAMELAMERYNLHPSKIVKAIEITRTYN